MEIKSLGKLLFLLVLVLMFSACIQHPGEYPTESVPTPTKTPIRTPTSLAKTPVETTPTPMETPTKKQVKPIITLIAPSPTPLTTVPIVIHTPTPFTFEFGKKYQAKVVRVIDGDTIDVLIDKIYRIRLLGVDCPETTAEKNKPYEYDAITDLQYLAEWGQKAKEFTRKMLLGKAVYIEFDELAGLKGYYGRYLAYVYLKNGTDFNALLIKNGLARVYVEGTFEKESEYLKLENYAKTHKIGLWAYSTYTTPTPVESGVKIVYIHYDAPGND